MNMKLGGRGINGSPFFLKLILIFLEIFNLTSILIVKVCEESSKVITFIDLAGHEKYLKTTGRKPSGESARH